MDDKMLFTSALRDDAVDEAFETAFDADRAGEIRAAYESVGPSEEAQARMLAALRAAASAKAATAEAPVAFSSGQVDRTGGAAGAQSAGSSKGITEKNVVAGGKPAPRKVPIRRWAAPVAAGAALVAVLVGGAAVLSSQGPSAAPVASGQTQGVTVQSEKTVAATGSETHVLADSAMESNAMVARTGDAYDAASVDIMLKEFNTEEYAKLVEGGFISTKARPLSTLSADVDTASYCNIRRMIRDGSGIDDIPSGAVRIEEMLNYFTYDYAIPQGDKGFASTVELAACPWNSETQLLVMGFATPTVTAAEREGANLVFLIDVSGSMASSDKLGLLQDAFAELTAQLTADDIVSIVTYSGAEEVVLDGASGADARSIQRAVDKLRASGSTNGEAGLRMAYDIAQKHYIDGGVNRIIMASDGDLNVGMTSTSDLYDFVEEKRETGIYLSVLGFGSGNYKDTKMETLADHGNGQYHYIDCVDEAKRVFGQNLLANLVPFADDVKVQVEFNPATVKGYRLIGYENRAIADEDFRNDDVDAGDVGPNCQFTVAYEIVLADSAVEVAEPELKYGAGAGLYTAETQSATASDLLTATLRWHEFDDGQVHELEVVVGADDELAQPSSDWKLAAAAIEFGMIVRDSQFGEGLTCNDVLALLEGAEESDDAEGFADMVRDCMDNSR